MPTARLVVVAAVLVEAVAVAGYGVWLAAEALVEASSTRLAVVFLGVTTVLLGAGLGLVARGVATGARGSRSPVLVWQALQAVVAIPAAYASADALLPRYVGMVLLGLCLVAGLGVLRRDVIDSDDVGGR